MIYILYLIAAMAVMLLSIKASEYMDLLDQKTSLSGAFIGGVMLSAVTSLPEMFTSISSAVLVDNPGLCIGNIMGSDLFNLTFFAILVIIFLKDFSKSDVPQSHTKVNISVFIVYIVVALNMLKILNFGLFNISITSAIILAIYVISIKFMAGDEAESTAAVLESPLTVKQITVRFIFVSIGIVAASIAITYLTDELAVRLNLGSGIAGALFLGVATSLPELSSTIALFKRRSFSIATGNIIGSNIFNFFILAFVDFIYIKGTVYDYSDPKTVNLLIFGAAATAFTMLLFKCKNKAVRVISCLAVVVCYALFLAI